MYLVKEITVHQEWDNFFQTQQYTPPVQSVAFGASQKNLGDPFFILGVYKEERLVAGSLVIRIHARRGNFFYLPYGPVCDASVEEDTKHIVDLFTKALVTRAKKENYAFIRMSPFWLESEKNKTLCTAQGFRDAPMHMLAETTVLLDVRADEETLMKQMKKNHRNLVRRCQKEGVTVTIATDREALDRFHALHDETAKRHKFTRFSRAYIDAEFDACIKDNNVFIGEAYLPDGRLDASAIITCFGSMAAYRHGASLNLEKKMPSSYLIQWTAIQEVKKRGLRYYNFWGIAPEGAPKSHPFSGITHFKKGFGGDILQLLPCQDYPVSIAYWKNWLIESIRRWKRGF